MNSKLKAFLIVSGYGAAGGALLGLASMAFGAESSAIAQGASLGLYAGIGFGSYVVLTHRNRYDPNPGLYQNSSPYSDPPPQPPAVEGGAGAPNQGDGKVRYPRGFFGDEFAPDQSMVNQLTRGPRFQMPLFRYQF